MKRFWLVLLSLGLIVAFSTSAMAVDVKFSGEYYAAGMYLDRTTLVKEPAAEGPSTAFYFQRLRLTTQFIVSPGLMLTTRADIMERAWGAARTAPGAVADTMSAGTRAENENIAFDLAYLTYVSPIGAFLVGYVIDGAWGTVFGDTSQPTPRITYVLQKGGIAFSLMAGKIPDGERSVGTFAGSVAAADRDDSFYTTYIKYTWKTGDAGLLFKYLRYAGNRDLLGVAGYQINQYVLVPYAKAKLGPVALQAELTYAFGKAPKWEGISIPGVTVDKDLSAVSAWVDATADFGMFYAGGSLAYMSGDDPGTADKTEGGLTGGRDWNPCLIMFNQDRTYWVGNLNGYGGTTNGAPMANAYFAQARAGVRPIDKLDIFASLSWAYADKAGAGTWESRNYGYEVDVTATYKITNNLSYMLGGGYWFVGDWYKGAGGVNTDLSKEFMVINKLTLTF